MKPVDRMTARREAEAAIASTFGLDLSKLTVKAKSRHVKRGVGFQPHSYYHVGRLIIKPRLGEPGKFDVMMKTTGMTLEQAKALYDFIEDARASWPGEAPKRRATCPDANGSSS